MLNFIQNEKLESLVRCGSVTDEHIANYLQGKNYEVWAEGKDLSATTEVVIGEDESGGDIIETQLVNIYTPIDVTTSVAQWKLDHYADLRRAEYPPITDFIDAHVKNDTAALDAYTAACLAVKARFPK